MSKTGKLGGAILGVALIGGAVVGINCMEKVPAGYVGVVYNFSSGISDQVLSQGWQFVSPTKKVTTYSIGISLTIWYPSQSTPQKYNFVDSAIYDKINRGDIF